MGGSGGSLGAAGIVGVAVTFDTFKNGTDPSANFIGVAKTGTGLAYNTMSTSIPTLRGSTRHVEIAVSGGHLTVAIDGVPKLDSTIASAGIGARGLHRRDWRAHRSPHDHQRRHQRLTSTCTEPRAGWCRYHRVALATPRAPATLDGIEASVEAKDLALVADIRLVGRLLGDVVRADSGTDVFALVEAARRAAVDGRRRGDDVAAALDGLLDDVPIRLALHVVRAFALFSLLANVAEDVHHNRRRHQHRAAGSAPQPGSIEAALAALVGAGLGPAEHPGPVWRVRRSPR